MDRLYIEQELALCSICIVAKPSPQEITELKVHYDVTDLGDNKIQIRYK